MIPNSNSQPVWAPPGTLKVYPLQALINDVGPIPMGNLKVFVKARLGAGVQESVVNSKQDRQPSWNQELAFRRKDETILKFELYNKVLIVGPILLGECSIILDPVFIEGQVTIKTDLLNKGKRIGSFQARLKWEPDNSGFRPVSQGYMSPNASRPPLVFHSNSFGQAPQFVPVQPQMFAPPGNPQQQTQVFVVRSPSFQQQQQQQLQPQVGSTVNLQALYGPNVNQGINYAPPPVASQEEAKDVDEPSDPDLPEEKKCVICLDKKKAGAFYKCGHICCCTRCGRDFLGKPCPICRQVVADFIKVFDS